MASEGHFRRSWTARSFAVVTLIATLSASGCFGKYWTHPEDPSVVASGEEHQVNFPDDQAFVMTQDVLRGQGVLFDVKPEHKILTFWKPADHPVGMLSSVAGNVAQYRYEIQVVADGSRRSRIISNVRTENVPDDEIDNYKASRKLNLFNDFDQLASRLPPPSLTPGSGGVNFALLPGEDLAALSKRVTGTPDNWHQIAKDNGLKSATDTAGLQSVWVANSLIPKANGGAPHHEASP